MGGPSAADCTAATCPVEEGFFSAPPSLEGAAFMLAAFAALIPINLWVGARCKTTTYTLLLVAGLVLEVLGYVGMLLLRSDAASKSYFVLLLLGTLIGSTFITAAVYTVLPHILGLYGSDVSIVPEPVWLSYFFFTFDAFTVAFLAVGSAFTAKGFSKIEMQQGINVIIAGLAFQILSTLGFFAAYVLLMSRVVQNRQFLDPRFQDVYLAARFKTALICIQIALTFILARTVARMVQFSSGLGSPLAQSQVYTLVLDGALVLIATILLTVVPPGPSFGRAWGITSPSTRKAQRHMAALGPIQPSPGLPSPYLQGSPVPSRPYQNVSHGRGYGPLPKEPRSPPPSVTTDGGSAATAMGSGYGGYNHRYHHHNRTSSGTDHQAGSSSTTRAGISGNPRRYSPNWMLPSLSSQKRQPSARVASNAEPPPYERPANDYTRVPFIPPSLSQQYGHGNIVESHVMAPGSEGTRTGGSGGGSGGLTGHTGMTGHTGRTRRSPRACEEDMVQHDSIW